MAGNMTRRVTSIKREKNIISHLCSSEFWSSVTLERAIEDTMFHGNGYYYVEDSQGRKAGLHLVIKEDGTQYLRYLRSDPDGNCDTNLEELPTCPTC